LAKRRPGTSRTNVNPRNFKRVGLVTDRAADFGFGLVILVHP
jgi:hypothetical protein